MTVATARFDFARVSCYWRAVILGGACAFLLSLFWFASRYPQLLGKAKHIGQVLPSMAYSRVSIAAASDASVWMRILDVAVNWLDGMKIGMTFGVLFGALLHTVLRYYPLKIGNNLYLNSLKGALVGVPMGLCVNCAVPAACGVTRGRGRVETALMRSCCGPRGTKTLRRHQVPSGQFDTIGVGSWLIFVSAGRQAGCRRAPSHRRGSRIRYSRRRIACGASNAALVSDLSILPV
jgi:hypothetical protein